MKQITLEEFSKYSLVINCDDERLNIMKRAFEKAGLPMPTKVPGIVAKALNNKTRGFRDSKNAESIAMSHLQCINMADALGWPFVVIFEDDAWPGKDAKECLEKFLSEIPDDALVFHLGYGKLRKRGEKVLRCGQQAYLVFREAFQIYRDAFASENSGVYNIDIIDRSYAPLANVLKLVEPNIFAQMEIRGGKAHYTTTYLCRAYQGTKPEDGWPTYEEVMNNG